MAVNSDKPHLWKSDVIESVHMYNKWFVEFAPAAFRSERANTIVQVEAAFRATGDLAVISGDVFTADPTVMQVLRMCTCPPIAQDRLVGLSGVRKNLVSSMEEKGRLPPNLPKDLKEASLAKVATTISLLLDKELFPWLEARRPATAGERDMAATIVADRLCGALANPIIRNAQERRQLSAIAGFLEARGYRLQALGRVPLVSMPPGTFTFRRDVLLGTGASVSLPMDAVVQPLGARYGQMPVLIEAKSAGDFTNTNKRRKEEAKKMSDLKSHFGNQANLVLFLCGYFDAGYLGYEAAEGIDWIWEHRIEDLDILLK